MCTLFETPCDRQKPNMALKGPKAKFGGKEHNWNKNRHILSSSLNDNMEKILPRQNRRFEPIDDRAFD